MIDQVIKFLEHWQDLSGAIIGGLMGFIGAWVVAKNSANSERRSERRLAVRIVYMDVAGFSLFAENLLEEDLGVEGEEVLIDPDARQRLAKQLRGYCYEISPLLHHYMPQILGSDQDLLASSLNRFDLHYRGLRALLRQFDNPTVGPDLQRIAEEFDSAYKFSETVVRLLRPQYLDLARVRGRGRKHT